jgi:hypothetical protein
VDELPLDDLLSTMRMGKHFLPAARLIAALPKPAPGGRVRRRAKPSVGERLTGRASRSDAWRDYMRRQINAII